MSECDEMKLKVQALADNELEEVQIPGVVGHIESCYRCREEYIQFLTLQKKMSGIVIQPNPEHRVVLKHLQRDTILLYAKIYRAVEIARHTIGNAIGER